MIKDKIVIGTWPLSGDYGRVDLKTVQKVLETCYDHDLKEFDTAPSYGNGFIELCLGKVLGTKTDTLINTKVGNMPFNGKSFKIVDLQASLAQSLKRLSVESLNILFLHNPRNEIDDYDAVLNYMNKLKQEGIIKQKGISLAKNFKYDLQFLDEFDVIQDDGNLLDMRFLSLELSKNTKFMARSPLASGILSGKMTRTSFFPVEDHRSSWLKGERLESIMKRVDKINEASDFELIDIAKQFIFSNEKVEKVIFGVRTLEHIDSILNEKTNLVIDKEIEKKLIDLYNNDYDLVGESHLGI